MGIQSLEKFDRLQMEIIPENTCRSSDDSEKNESAVVKKHIEKKSNNAEVTEESVESKGPDN